MLVQTKSIDSAALVAYSLVPLMEGGVLWIGAWIHYQIINKGRPITVFQRTLMRYWTFFVVGAGYGLIFPAVFHMSRQWGWLLVAAWALVSWTLYRRRLEKMA